MRMPRRRHVTGCASSWSARERATSTSVQTAAGAPKLTEDMIRLPGLQLRPQIDAYGYAVRVSQCMCSGQNRSHLESSTTISETSTENVRPRIDATLRMRSDSHVSAAHMQYGGAS